MTNLKDEMRENHENPIMRQFLIFIFTLVDMNKKNSIQFTGRAGLLFTDENGMTYRVNSEILASKQYDMVIFTKDIEPKDSNHKLEDKDKEMIISKIFELTKGIKWLVK